MDMDGWSQIGDAETQDCAPTGPVVLADGVDALSQVERSDGERRTLLLGALDGQLADGARIESQDDFHAVLVRGRPIRHLMHFVISLLTIGIWCPIWILTTAVGGEKRTTVDVDRFGNVFVKSI
jgi:hypothetical protein